MDQAEIFHLELIGEDRLELVDVVVGRDEEAVINVDGNDEDIAPLSLDIDARVRLDWHEAAGA